MGFPPIKADKPKDAGITLFQAGSDYFLSARRGNQLFRRLSHFFVAFVPKYCKS